MMLFIYFYRDGWANFMVRFRVQSLHGQKVGGHNEAFQMTFPSVDLALTCRSSLSGLMASVASSILSGQSFLGHHEQ